MSAGEDERPDAGGDDLLAAEFALGILSGAEQAVLARRVAVDHGFARAVAAWEERLAPMAEGYGAVDLPAKVKQALDRHLFGIAGPAPKAGFWSNLAIWRGVAAASATALLLVIALPLLQPAPSAAPGVMAALSTEASDVQYMAVYDAASGVVRLAHLSGIPASGQVFELWVAEGSAAPVSLGVIPVGATVRMPTGAKVRGLLTNRAHMAISLEPLGGSPTGQPTGDVVALGNLLDI